MMSHQPILINTTNGTTSNNLQTIQHYLVNGHIQSAPIEQQQTPLQNVHVQILKQEQSQQRYILNHKYIQHSPVHQQQHQIQNQQQVQVQTEQLHKVYWLLVEIESNNELNSYALVESKDVVGQPPFETMGTGKMVLVNINKQQCRANVIMSSYDKNFIFAEYNLLTEMAEENLKKRDIQVRKRRRVSGSETGRKETADDDSSLSGWSTVSQNINTDRVVSPSAHIQHKSKAYETRFIPPMTFDQGTQTDTRITGGGSGGLQDKIHELQRLIELNEHILNEQKLMKHEAKLNRTLVESFSDEFSAMRKSMQMIESKFENLTPERQQFDVCSVQQNEGITRKVMSSKILNGSGTHPYFIIEAASDVEQPEKNSSLTLNGSNLEYTVEEMTEADDSGRSTSRLSYHDQTSMMSNSSADFGTKKEFHRSHSSSNFSVNSSSSTPITRANSNSNLTEEWAEMEGDVMIGTNKTSVAAHVLRSIDWRNYKTATRKLLISLFTRETLATRSLTGRPSPAFHDRNKPVKGKLDQNIINDIIQIVTRKCVVQESQVRTAITTKCADENKMLRNRSMNAEKEFKAPSVKSENKENIIGN